MMGTLVRERAGTAGAKGCLLLPYKRACCIKLWTAHKRLGVAGNRPVRHGRPWGL